MNTPHHTNRDDRNSAVAEFYSSTFGVSFPRRESARDFNRDTIRPTLRADAL